MLTVFVNVVLRYLKHIFEYLQGDRSSDSTFKDQLFCVTLFSLGSIYTDYKVSCKDAESEEV